MHAINELFPNWKEIDGHPFHTPVAKDKFAILSEKRRLDVPIFKGE